MAGEVPQRPAPRGLGWLAAAALAVIFLLAFGLRSAGYPRVFLEDRTVVFALADAQYHVRRARWTLENYPKVLSFDPYINHPHGAPVPWPPLYDFFVASVARALGGSEAVLERVAAWLPPLLGSLAVLPVFAIGRRIRGPTLGLGAAALYASLQIAVNYAAVGDADHHGAIALIGACLLAVYLALLDEPARGWSVVRLFAGLFVARSALLLAWQGSLLHLGLGELALVLYASFRGRGDLLVAQAVSAAASAAVIAPFVLAAQPLVGGLYSAVELSRLHLLALVAEAGVAGGAALLESLRPARTAGSRAGLRAGRVALLAALAGAAVAAFPEPREGVLRAFEWLTKSDEFAELVAENRPLFGDFSAQWRHWGEFLTGYYGYLIPVVPLAFLGASRGRAEKAPLLFLALWSAFSGALAFSQVRYGNDFAAVGCVGFALLLAQATGALARVAPRARRGAPLLAVALGALLLWPTFEHAHSTKLRNLRAHLAGESIVGDPRYSVELSALRFARAVREATPATGGLYAPDARPEYAVLSLPLFGHVLHYQAERATPADNFGAYIGRENFDAARRFFLELRSEEEAVRTARELGARYVVTFQAENVATPATVAARLHRQDGSAQSTRPQLGRFRLVTEGPKGGMPVAAMFTPDLDRRGPPYKLFEVVEGAVLEVAATPGEWVSAVLVLRSPIGRSVRFAARGRADGDGLARLRVPYPTAIDAAAPTKALGPYRVQTEGRTLRAHVSEDDVREGRAVRVEEAAP